MPCDTPPPEHPVDDIINEGNDGDVDDAMYDFIDDIDELEMLEVEDDEFDKSIITFDGHRESVFCCNFDKTGKYVVTGGQDDVAYVWSIQDKAVKFECTGHSDSVISVSFSPDSKYVATADMNGLIQVWDVECGIAVWDFEASEITHSEWLRGANVLIASTCDSSCWRWSIPDGVANVFSGAGAACTIFCTSHNDEKLVTGYSDGSLKLWNLSSSSLLNTLSASSGGDKVAITAIKFNEDSSLILAGLEDGTAKIIKVSDFKVLWSVKGCENSQHDHSSVSVEDVGFCHNLPFIVLGTNCGLVCIWDMNSKTRRAEIELSTSVVKIVCDSAAPILYVAIGDGTLHAYDIRTGDAVKYWHGHKAAILDLAISSDRTLLATVSDDSTCKIFERGVF